MKIMTIMVAFATLLPVAASAQQTTPGARRARPGAAATARGDRVRPDAQARRGRDTASDPILDRILAISELKLTDEQVAKLRALSEKARAERQKEFADRRKDMQKDGRPADGEREKMTAEQRDQLKAELRKTQEKTRRELMEVLTKEQRQIVAGKLQDRRGDRQPNVRRARGV
jgi:Spy/CpxP family protein refolding chaperone